MKKLFVLCVLVLASFQAHAVNNRTIILDAAAPGAVEYRLFCGTTTNDTTTFSATAVFIQTGGAAFQRAVAFADNVKFCALRSYGADGLSSGLSNVLSVTPPGTPFIRITTIETFGIGPDGKFEQLSRVATAEYLTQ